MLLVMGMGQRNERDEICHPDTKNVEECPLRTVDPQTVHSWEDLNQSQSQLLTAGAWCLIGAGVLGIGTAVYALTGSKPAAPPRAGHIQVHPAGTGIGVRGFW